MKAQLLDVLEAQFGHYRTRYNELMANPAEIDRILADGAEKAHSVARQKLDEVRVAIGA